MREFEVSLDFFPVSRKSDLFFMRLPVGSVAFVSHGQGSEVSRTGKVSAKNTSQGREDFLYEPVRLDLSCP